MKKLRILLTAVLTVAVLCSGIAVAAQAETADGPTPYVLDLSSETVWDSLLPVYIEGSGRGAEADATEYWKKEGTAVTRTGTMYDDSSRYEENYSALYLKDCYYRYFELNTRIKYGAKGLTGILFGKKDMLSRHLSDGNALYMLPDPCVEIKGSTLTVKKTSPKFGAKNGYYDVTLKVCADYVRCYIDGELRIDAVYSADLIQYGRIGLFTANTAGSFDSGVEIYNLDEHGNRIKSEQSVLVTGITAQDESLDMVVGEDSKKFVYSVLPDNAANLNVRFLSDNPDIATADVNGNIYALKAGTANVFAITEDGGYTAGVRVVVTETIPQLAGITLDKAEGVIDAVGGKLYLTAGIYPADAENQGYKWSSSDTRVAIVNNGTVTAMGEGECTITVRDYYGNYQATCKVTVGAAQEEKSGGGCKSTAGGSAAVAAAITLIAVAAVILHRRKRANG